MLGSPVTLEANVILSGRTRMLSEFGSVICSWLFLLYYTVACVPYAWHKGCQSEDHAFPSCTREVPKARRDASDLCSKVP